MSGVKEICKEMYILNAENIDRMSERLQEILEHPGVKRTECLRLRLSMEEILLNWMEEAAGADVQLFVEGKRRKLCIVLEMKGERLDPFPPGDGYGNAAMAGSILSNLGMVWFYQYAEGVNQVSISVEGKKPGQLRQIGAAVALAALTGVGFSLLPDAVAAGASRYVLDPLFDTFMGFLSAVVGPMMFLSMVWGVFSIGNPRQLGSIGKKVCGNYLFHNCLAVALGVAAVALFFPFRLSGAEGGAGQLEALLDMLYDIIPDNFVTPFVTGNTMQIIFLAVVVGVTMIVIQDQVPAAAAVVEQCNIIIQRILAAVCSLVPAFIYLSIVRLTLSDQTGNLMGVVKMIVIYLVLTVLLIGIYLAGAWKQLGVPPGLVFRKVFPAYLIALTTASSAAAFAECTEGCVRRLGIDKKLVDFGLPLGIVVFMPNFAMWMVLFGGACAEYYQTVLSPVNLLMLAVIGVFLAVAAPPVPGGALTCYTILLMQMNIPLEMLAVASAVNMVMDFTGTAGHILAVQVQLLRCADDLGMLDRRRLMK